MKKCFLVLHMTDMGLDYDLLNPLPFDHFLFSFKNAFFSSVLSILCIFFLIPCSVHSMFCILLAKCFFDVCIFPLGCEYCNGRKLASLIHRFIHNARGECELDKTSWISEKKNKSDEITLSINTSDTKEKSWLLWKSFSLAPFLV